MKAHIVILVDNSVASHSVLAEHGLSFWVETDEHCLLFDTGQGLVVENNARALNLDLEAVDTIVLSHGHYDHTGGLGHVVQRAGRGVRLAAHPDALLPKYKRNGAMVKDIGMSPASRAAVEGLEQPVITTPSAREIVPGLWVTGEIPRRHPEETTLEGFCADPGGTIPDPLRDDQALFLDTAQGIVVLLGCAHAGLVNTLDHIRQLTDRPIRAVLGGTHLRVCPGARLDWTIAALKEFRLRQLVPMHCTGLREAAMLCAAFPDASATGGVGSRFDF